MANSPVSYRGLSPDERMQLWIAAVERDDLEEARRILSSCRRCTVRASDPEFVNRIHAAAHVAEVAGHAIAVALGRMEVWLISLSVIRSLLMSVCDQINEASAQSFLSGKFQAYTENGASASADLLTEKQFDDFVARYGGGDESERDRLVRQTNVAKQFLREYLADCYAAVEHLAGFDAFARSELGVSGRALLKTICPDVDATLTRCEPFLEGVTPSQTKEVYASYQERWDAFVVR